MVTYKCNFKHFSRKLKESKILLQTFGTGFEKNNNKLNSMNNIHLNFSHNYTHASISIWAEFFYSDCSILPLFSNIKYLDSLKKIAFEHPGNFESKVHLILS